MSKVVPQDVGGRRLPDAVAQRPELGQPRPVGRAARVLASVLDPDPR
jgi:hypothetical protein